MDSTRPQEHTHGAGPWLDLDRLSRETGADISPLRPREDPLTIGPWRLVARLPFGGMSRLFLAAQVRGSDELVVVKLLRQAPDPIDVDRLLREFHNAGRIDAPHVARVLDSGAQPEPYLVMEFVRGPTLRRLLDNAADTPIGTGRAVAIATALLDALACVHAAGVAHRDLTPRNIVLSDDPGPVLIDFGTSHHYRDQPITRTGTYIGTAGFMSPERIKGRGDTKADVFSWGVIAALMLGGRHPYQPDAAEPTFEDFYWRMTDSRGPDLHAVPQAYQRVLHRALDPDPTRRPTAAELQAWIDQIAMGAGAAVVEPGPQATKRSPFGGLRGLNARGFVESLRRVVAVSNARAASDRRHLLTDAVGWRRRVAVRLLYSRAGPALARQPVRVATVAAFGVVGLLLGSTIPLAVEVMWLVWTR